jgi:hypothetical protein
LSFSLPARRFYNRNPPRAAQLALPGGVVPIAVTTSPGFLAFASIFPQVPAASSFGQQIFGVQGQRIILYADASDIGIITGAQIADVTGANAPVFATVATVNGTTGVVSGVAGSCWRILTSQTLEFEVNPSQDFYLGFVGSASGTLRIFQCSGSNS